MNGILNVYKEPGFTSFDVVAKLRGICKQRKIGHTGTLDPAASGVLPVCLGNATRVVPLLTEHDKEYCATLFLGVETDTQDATGKIIARHPLACDVLQVREAVMSFVGIYEQLPPMYSALKVNGQKLCDLARAGKEVERKSRRVTIDSIVIEEMALPRVRMRVVCSKGTYIRTLCHDIGRKLGCSGMMETLTRTRVGGFLLADAKTLSEIEELANKGKLSDILLPVDEVFAQLPAVEVAQEGLVLLQNGNPLESGLLQLKNNGTGESQVRLYDREGRFYGVYEWRKEKDRYMPVKMFL